MKKVTFLLLGVLVCLLLVSSVIAQQGQHGNPNNKIQQTNNKENTTPVLIKTQEIRNLTREIREERVELKEVLKNYSNLTLQEREQVREEVRTQLRNIRENITELRNRLQEEVKNLKEEERIRAENTNRVRLAVHALLAMENLSGGIGRNVSLIAREFNNSVQSSLRNEEKIQNRNKLMRFLFGSDLKAVKEMEQENLRLREMINKLNDTINNCGECTEEVKEMMQEQLRIMLQEQERLNNSVQKEKKVKGLLGWITRR